MEASNAESLEPKIETEAVELWNPDVASALSLILSPIFGSIIHALNWSRLGDRRRQLVSWIWAAVLLVAISYLSVRVVSQISNPALVQQYDGLINLTACIIWYFFSGRQQSKYVTKELRKKYTRRSWFAPICFAVIVFGGLMKLGSM